MLLDPPRLMLVTDRSLCPVERLPALVADLVRNGVDAVQLREKDLPPHELLDLARDLRAATAGRARLFVNGAPVVARAAGADGVHLGEYAEAVAAVRVRVGRALLIGRSVHSLDGAMAAERDGADLLVLGTVYPSRSHPGGITGGPALVAQVCARVSPPVLGIGGITRENAAAVIRAGAAGVAVISAILAAPVPAQAAWALREVIDTALAGERQPT